MSGTARRYCFTLFLEDVDELRRTVTSWFPIADPVRFLVCQIERCPSTGRHHVQGYIELTRSVRFSALHRLLHRSLSLRESHGTAEQNIAYCTKDDTRILGPWREGAPVSQGNRTDIAAARESVEAGHNTMALWQNHFPVMVKYYKAIYEFRSVFHRKESMENQLHTEPVYQPIHVHVYWGDSGAGKTRRAFYEAHHPYIASVPFISQPMWFDGYQPGQDIILDDFSGEVPLNWLKRFLDIYPFELPVKGALVPRVCRGIYITSNTSPTHWYPLASQTDLQALTRRFTTCEHMTLTHQPWCPPSPTL